MLLLFCFVLGGGGAACSYALIDAFRRVGGLCEKPPFWLSHHAASLEDSSPLLEAGCCMYARSSSPLT